MAEQLPPPPVPADADLTHYDDMPLEVRRLRDSGIAGVPDAEIFRCAVLLWCVAWHQLPAGSLPNDDDELCRLVGLGRDRRTWSKIKAGVLRGWRRFDDGRLYHRVVSEKVIEGWNRTRFSDWQKACDRVRKENKARKDKGLAPLEFPEKPAVILLEWPPESRGSSSGNSGGVPPERHGPSGGIPPENALKGKEQNGKEYIDSAAAPSGTGPPHARGGGNPPEKPPVDRTGPQAAMASRAETDEAYELWVPVAAELGIPDPGYLNSARRPALAARLAECGGIEGWTFALQRLREARFLIDRDGRPKRWVNLMSLCKPENFTGLMEGRYAEHYADRDDGKPTVSTGLAGLAQASLG